MGKLAAIRQGIAANLAALNGTAGVQVSAYVLAEPTPPTVQVLPAPITYDVTMARGVDEYTLTVQALAPLAADAVHAQHLLDELIDEPNSIKSLIEADRTLGGVAHHLRVTDCSGYQVVSLEGRGPTLFCEWTVVVLATGN
jgi:hypothetical protein